MCRPEIDRMCARPEARIISWSSRAIQVSCPVVMAAATPPVRSPSRATMRCARSKRAPLTAISSRNRHPGGGRSANRVSPKAKATPPMPSKKALRPKSYAPGAAGGGGGFRMANIRTGRPGSGGAPLTVARRRTGVSSGASPRMRTGATMMRCPRSPGESTSTTQASTVVGSAMAGAIGASTVMVFSRALAMPIAVTASISRGHVQARPAPARLSMRQAPSSTSAIAPSGHSGGSKRRAK